MGSGVGVSGSHNRQLPLVTWGRLPTCQRQAGFFTALRQVGNLPHVEIGKLFKFRSSTFVARLKVQLLAPQVAAGMHIDRGCTVIWGLVYLDGQVLTYADVVAALKEAGLDSQFGEGAANVAQP
jgi:hypothetical protein